MSEEAHLEVVAGPAAGSLLRLGEELVIGRGEPGEGALGGDAELSRRHAGLRAVGGDGVLIEDLGSTNGTYVDGEAISAPTLARVGSTVVVGATTLRVADSDRAEGRADGEDLARGGVQALPSDLIGTLIARAPVRRDWVLRAALQSVAIILAVNFIIRTIAVEYLDVASDVGVMMPHVLLLVSVMPVLGSSLGFYHNFGHPGDISPLRYMIPGLVITCVLCTIELLLLPADAGVVEHAVTVLIALVAPSVVTPTMLGLRVRAARAAEARFGRR